MPAESAEAEAIEAQLAALTKQLAEVKKRDKHAKRNKDEINDGEMLAPASPSPRKKARSALMNPVKTDSSRSLLASHKEQQQQTRRGNNNIRGVSTDAFLSQALDDRSSSRRYESSYNSSSAHPVASTSRASYGKARRDDDLASSLAAEEDRARLAHQRKPAPTNLLDANLQARQRLKNNDSQRGMAMQRSTGFHEAAPTKSMPKSTQPIPNYNDPRYGRRGGSSSHGASRYNSDGNGGRQYHDSSSDNKSNSGGGFKGKNIQKAGEILYANESKQVDAHFKENYIEKDPYTFEEDEIGLDDDDVAYQDVEYRPQGNERNDDMTIIHRLKPGPKHFKPPELDKTFEKIEPNSKIYLKKRLLPHADLQEYLSDRFYIPPSLLYSIVRPTKGGTDYEVPVEGDWIVIGVLAEKSEIKYTGAGSANNVAKQLEMRKKMAQERANKAKEAARMEKARKFREARQNGKDTASAGNTSFDDKMFDEMAKSDDELRDAFEGSDAEGGGMMDLGQADKNKKKKKQEEEEEDKEPPARRRYITFKLVDLGEKGAGGGAGILSLKLFESDPDKRRTIKHADSSEEELETVVNKRTGGKVLVTKKRKESKRSKSNKDIDDEVDGDRFERKEYKGGSGGAFEKFWKETNGTVVAILNPRIMKPWSPHGQNESASMQVFSLTPESAESVIVIGKSRDLGSCQARKKDGNLCNSWCDIRVDSICDYHIQQAVSRRRAGRSELLSGTGGMQTTNVSGNFNSLSNRPAHSKGQVFSGGTSHSAPYDPVNKIGLLPRHNTSVQEGSKTYVVKSGPPGTSLAGGAGNRTGGYRTGLLGAPAPGFIRPASSRSTDHTASREIDPKELAKKKMRERESIEALLAKEGGKSVGSKYLISNGKAKGTTTTRSEGEGEDSAVSQSELEGDSDDRIDRAPRHEAVKKRVFSVDSLRKIGYDPTSMPAHMDAKAQKRKMEALQVLGDPETYQPKLGQRPNKSHSNIIAPSTVKGAGKRVQAGANSGSDSSVGYEEDASRPPRRRVESQQRLQRKLDSSSDSGEDAVAVPKSVPGTAAPAASELQDEESDLEIEPPVAS